MFSKATQISERKTLSEKFQVLLPVVYLLPFFFLIRFIQTYSVDVPFGDEWELVELFRKVTTKEVSFFDFFSQHNEHRIFFPKLIFTALAFLSSWNLKDGMYFSAFLALVSFLLICTIGYRQAKQRDLLFHITNFGTSIAIFSIIQHNWLWYFQGSWFFANLCLVSCIFFLTSGMRSLWFKVCLGAISCFVASFTLIHGLMTWIAAIPCLLILPQDSKQPKQIWRIVAIWTSLLSLTCFIYFYNYFKPPAHPDPFLFLKKPFLTAEYFFTVMGISLDYQSKNAFLFGFIIFVAFLSFFIRYIKEFGSEISRNLAPWLSIGLFAIFFELVTTLGRAGFGVRQAHSLRYTTVSILLIISLLHLWRATAAHRTRGMYQAIGIVSALTFLVWSASINSIGEAKEWKETKQYSQDCLALSSHVDQALNECLTNMHPNVELVRGWTKTLNQIGFRDDPQTIRYVTNSSKNYGLLEVIKPDAKSLLIQKSCLNCSDILEIPGWAILPDQRKAARLVLISYGKANQNPGTFITTAYVNKRSSDIAKVLNSKRYSRAKWVARVSIKLLPIGETVLKAWVYDPKNKQLVKLPGQAKVRVEE